MRLHEQYTKEIHDELNYVATWFPTVKLAPGDVCTMENYELRVVSTLNELEVSFDVEDAPVETDIEYTSEGAVDIHIKASGEPPPTGSLLKVEEAGVTLTFARSNAVLLRMAACTSRRIKSLHKVGEQVMKLHEAKRWPDGYVVVSQIVQAGASTIIISKGEKAGMDLAAKAGIGQGTLTLASLDAGLQVKRESKIGAKFIAAPGLTPLVVTSGVQKRILRPDVFRGKRSAAAAAPQGFGLVSYPDFASPSQ